MTMTNTSYLHSAMVWQVRKISMSTYANENLLTLLWWIIIKTSTGQQPFNTTFGCTRLHYSSPSTLSLSNWHFFGLQFCIISTIQASKQCRSSIYDRSQINKTLPWARDKSIPIEWPQCPRIANYFIVIQLKTKPNPSTIFPTLPEIMDLNTCSLTAYTSGGVQLHS